MYGREHHTIVRQLSSNLKIHREREREAGGGCRREQPVWGISVEEEGPSSLETAVMAEAISDSVKA